MNIDRIKQIQARAGYPDSKSVQQALLQVWNEVSLHEKWKPISTAPRDGTFILILMDSGFTTTPYGVIIAQFVEGYKCDGDYDHRWRDHANDSVHDGFEKIIAWTEWNVPKIEFEPDEGIYEYLAIGDEVKPGDETQNKDKTGWITITEKGIEMWFSITGERLTHTKLGSRTRRRIKR